MKISIWEVNEKSIRNLFIDWNFLVSMISSLLKSWYSLVCLSWSSGEEVHSKTIGVLRNLWIMNFNITWDITQILNQIGQITIEIDWPEKILFLMSEIEKKKICCMDSVVSWNDHRCFFFFYWSFWNLRRLSWQNWKSDLIFKSRLHLRLDAFFFTMYKWNLWILRK